MAVVAPTEPTAILHMVANMLRVVRASRTRGSHWIDFDKEYHMKAAAQGSRRWSVHDGKLWDYYITATATAHTQSNVPAIYRQDRVHSKGLGSQTDQSVPRGPPGEGQRARGTGHWHGIKEYATHAILMGHVQRKPGAKHVCSLMPAMDVEQSLYCTGTGC